MTDNIREKLVDAINGYFGVDSAYFGNLADHLLANGVTIQQWIPVSERLPEKDKSVLVYFDSGNMAVGYWYEKDECVSFWQVWTDDGWVADTDCEPIYWMPLPPAPKGE
jgi:hypothetical protein